MLRRSQLRRARKVDALASLARVLGGTHTGIGRRGGEAVGEYRGVTLVHRLTTRQRVTGIDDDDAIEVDWTEVEVPGLDGEPLSLLVLPPHRLGLDDRTALELGDAAFDGRFHVSGASPEHAAALLPTGVRAYLCALDDTGVEVEVVAVGERCLRLGLAMWVADPEVARAAWDAIVDVRAAACEVHEIGEGYRARPDTAAKRTGWERG